MQAYIFSKTILATLITGMLAVPTAMAEEDSKNNDDKKTTLT